MNRPKEIRNPQKLRFLTSAVDLRGCPQDEMVEVALIGRSNAGKSSLINGLAGGRIAQVSSTPGKTRLLNFYQGPAYRLVDMPGYGFSKRSGDEQASWQSMIEPYLRRRDNLTGLLLVMDIRRDWSQDEQDIVEWMRPRALPVAIVVTKADKLSRSQVLLRQKLLREQSGQESVLVTSALNQSGFTELDEFVFATWIKSVAGR